jgi:hypothetical protein
MSFAYEFEYCMHGAYLPTPAEISGAAIETAGDVIEFLEELHHAAEAAGGLEITLGALEAAGALGLGSLAEQVAAVTVSAYVGACVGCLIGAGFTTVWDSLSEVQPSPEVRAEIVAAAENAGLTPPDEAKA